MRRLLSACIALAACEPSDHDFLALDALPAPATTTIGIPVRVTALGGRAARLELVQGRFWPPPAPPAAGEPPPPESSRCFVVGKAAEAGSAAIGSAIVIVVPDDVETLVIGRVFASCDASAEAGTALASEQLAVRTEEPNGSMEPPAGGGS